MVNGIKRPGGCSDKENNSCNKKNKLNNNDGGSGTDGGGPIILPTPRKSPSDSKNYRAIKLHNGLVVLLISNTAEDFNPDWSQSFYYIRESLHDNFPTVLRSEYRQDTSKIGTFHRIKFLESQKNNDPFKRAAISVGVKVGSANDPQTNMGMAHMLEHMLFLGSEKYPAEDYFENFINLHGGNYNAYTLPERTVYYIELNPEKVGDGLELLEDMLLHPSLNEECAQREMENVESDDYNLEYLMRRSEINVQLYEVIKMTTIEGHPIGYFHTGSVQTLKKTGIRDQLLNFHRRHYTTDNMVLVVQSPDTLDSLQILVERHWGKVERQQDTQKYQNKQKHEINPYNLSKFGKLYKISSGAELMVMLWHFPPEIWRETERRPFELLSFILSDTREGSLSHFFLEKKWADSVSSTADSDNYLSKYDSLFSITISLLEDGVHNVDKVVQCVYDYLSILLHDDALPKKTEMWLEMKTMREQMFNYEGGGNPLNTTMTAAELLLEDPLSTENIFTRSLITTEYRDDLFQKLVGETFLHPENTLYIQFTHREKLGKIQNKLQYCGSVYSVEDIPVSFCAEVDYPELTPALTKNPWLSKHFPIFRSIGDFEIDFRRELAVTYSNQLTLPRALWQFKIWTGMKLDLTSSKLLSVWAQYMRLKLNSTIGMAARAGVQIHLSYHPLGVIAVKIFGFPQKIPKLWTEISSEIFSAKNVSQETYECAKQAELRGYKNLRRNNFSLLGHCKDCIMFDTPNDIDNNSKISDFTKDQMETCIKMFRKQMFTHGWIVGNSSLNEAIEYTNRLKILTEKYDSIPVEKYTMLGSEQPIWVPSSRDLCFRIKNVSNPSDDNNYIFNYYQLASHTSENVTFLEIIIALMTPYTYHQLRTISHLGYAVGIYNPFPGFQRATMCLYIISPSSKFSMCELSSKMDELLHNFFVQRLNTMQETEFSLFINEFLKRPSNRNIPISSPDPVTLAATKEWYWNKVVKCLPANNGGEFYGISKLSLQLIGNPNEKCKTPHCHTSSWKVGGNPDFQFGAPESAEKSKESSGQKFFIWNVKEFHENALNIG